MLSAHNQYHRRQCCDAPCRVANSQHVVAAGKDHGAATGPLLGCYSSSASLGVALLGLQGTHQKQASSPSLHPQCWVPDPASL